MFLGPKMALKPLVVKQIFIFRPKTSSLGQGHGLTTYLSSLGQKKEQYFPQNTSLKKCIVVYKTALMELKTPTIDQ